MKKRSVGEAHQLFIQVISKLGTQGNLQDNIPEILKATCRYFQFGCGFIYEASYEKIFKLKEIHSYYDKKDLPDSMDIFSILTQEQISEFIALGTAVIKPGEQKSELLTKLHELFSSQLLVLSPIINNEGELIGLLGLSDRRGDIVLSPMDFEVALSVLRAVGNQVKLRTYQTWLENTRNALESVLDNIAVDIYVADFSTYEIIYANSSIARLFDGQENIIGKPCWEVQKSEQADALGECVHDKLLDENGDPTKTYSWDFLRSQDNTWQRATSACFRWVDGRLANVVSSVNITENKNNEELIRHMADYDDLTGLPNRRKLIQDIDKLLKGKEGEAYVLFFDLDSFKCVNDDLGHQAGDELLVQVGQALQSSTLIGGHCYRHSGDEFVLIYKDITWQRLLKVIESVRERFIDPWQLRDGIVKCTCSMGISHYPSDGWDALDLLHASDLAMYASKRKGRNMVYFYNMGQLLTLTEWQNSKGGFIQM
ncbi:MAG: sensor domain-containing diguanylate cyclase [Firmicutes bacterium]|nr:sensor domain-containing diguanylate cyclase [Bacillota bacterium]